MSVVVETINLSFSYENGIKILDKVNFKINKGEFVLLTGQSGEGKSTLIFLLNGIIPNLIYGKKEGDILINEKNISGKTAGELAREVGIVLQNADHQIVEKYVEDELAFGGENLGFKKETIQYKIDLITKLMKINPNAKCRELSGGQKQKLIIGSTLLMGQKILILDEPLANLDLNSSIELLNLLKSLSCNGYTIIVSEHRIDLILKYADRILAIKDKKVVETSKEPIIFEQKSNIIQCENLEKPCKTQLFSLKNAFFKIKNNLILEDVSLEIFRGEKVLLLGENGVGTTTLMRILGGLNKLKIGEYSHDLIKEKRHIKIGSSKWFKKVGIVYQNPNYQLFMNTVLKEIYFNCYSKEYADYIISLFNLKNLLSRHPQSLSEGQKRKVSIAAILAMKPDVLLLDEPTVGQDYNSLKSLIEIINKIHKETNNTIISVTHDIRCASALCDKAVWLKDKKICKIGDKSVIDDYFYRQSKRAEDFSS